MADFDPFPVLTLAVTTTRKNGATSDPRLGIKPTGFSSISSARQLSRHATLTHFYRSPYFLTKYWTI